MLGIKRAPSPEDVVPEFPEPLAYLWDDFREIIGGLQGNGWSYPVITWECLEAWSRLTGRQIEPRECKVIVRLGALRASILNESLKPKDAANS
jgi:hypothetical protein